MPLLKFHVVRGAYSTTELQDIQQSVHEAMVQSFQVPERDRYQIVNEYDEGRLVALDTGLGFERTQKFILIEVVSRPRSVEEKSAFYEASYRRLNAACGLGPKDLMVTFQINADEDWSFADGRAQFLSGEL
ncbi:tautomerase family protein [Rhizobium binxianense]|jgi:hypothetical protein